LAADESGTGEKTTWLLAGAVLAIIVAVLSERAKALFIAPRLLLHFENTLTSGCVYRLERDDEAGQRYTITYLRLCVTNTGWRDGVPRRHSTVLGVRHRGAERRRVAPKHSVLP